MNEQLEAEIAREFWAGHMIDGRPAGWGDMSHAERLRAIDDYSRRHAPPVTKAVVRAAPPPAAPTPADTADRVVAAVKVFLNARLDAELGKHQDELLSYVRSFERRITALEDQLAQRKASD